MGDPRRIDRVRSGDFDRLIKTQPREVVGELIDEPAVVYEDGKPMLGHFFVPDSLLRDIRRVVKGTKPQKSSRTNGLPTQSTVYGVMPRNNLRTDYCRFTSATRKEGEFFQIMNHYCEVLCEVYERHFPEAYRSAIEEVHGAVVPDWRHNRTPFQTININVNHAIKYHRDTGNFRKAMSTVLIVKDEIAGGELTVPEYDMTLAQRDGAFTVFDGQSLVHGVLPIRRLSPRGYRASIVFYSMNALKNCYPYQAEIDRLAAREKDKSTVRYTLENKKALIRMNRRALARINSPWLQLIEGEEHNGRVRIDGVRGDAEGGQADGEVSGAAGDVRRESDPGGLEE